MGTLIRVRVYSYSLIREYRSLRVDSPGALGGTRLGCLKCLKTLNPYL